MQVPNQTFDEALAAVYGIFKDITDPVAWQRALREEEERDIYADKIDFSTFSIDGFRQIDGMEYQKEIRDEWC